MANDELRKIPSVTEISDRLNDGLQGHLSSRYSLDIAKAIQSSARAAVLAGLSCSVEQDIDQRIQAICDQLDSSRYTPIINGTGIVIHTNLGRAPVSISTAMAMSQAAQSAVSLEVDPESGRRGGRMTEISNLVRLLTGAEATLVVNNNAAAVLLVLSALARGRRVAISRSEAVEIGGGFRVPDILRQSGAELIEVGTTNRTYASDYQAAVADGADILLKVHSSNFEISGFIATPDLDELRSVANEGGAVLIEDLGSGTLLDTSAFSIEHEPTIQQSIASGVDIVMFSGDKLLGGPQAGIIAGRADLVEKISTSPLARAVRADKVTLAGVAATLRHYLRGDAVEQLPVWRMISATPESLRERATALARAVESDSLKVTHETTTNFVGGGSLPGQALPGIALSVTASGTTPEGLARSLRLRKSDSVFGRIDRDTYLIELRTILPESDAALVSAIVEASAS